MTKLQNDFRTVERGLIRDVSNLIDLNEEDIARMMGSPTEIEAIDQQITEQGIDMEQFNALPDSIKTGIRALAAKNLKEDKPIFDEIDLEDLQNADSVEDFEQVLIDNRFKLKEINGKKVYVPPDAVETQNIEDDIKDAFNFDDDIKKKNKELENKKNEEISFNSIKNERNFEVAKKSKDVFIPLNDVINNSFTKQQNNSDTSIALNSTDNNKDYASFENQFLNSIG